MKIAMMGTGYVGLVTGTLLADRGNRVTCIDKNPAIIERLHAGHVHIFEPGLESILRVCEGRGDLSFSTQFMSAVANADVIFLAVGTPSDADGSFNLTALKAAAADVGRALRHAKGFKVVIGKSTVPQGTWRILCEIIDAEIGDNSELQWAYVANPETLAEGTAVRDFSKPDRILVGTTSDRAFAIVQELYHPFNIKSPRVLRGTPAEAELAKLFSNTALAARIAMVNEFARVADVTPGADMDVIRQMICSDDRIGYNFMFPSPGYGGSCFPKDVQGLVSQAIEDGFHPSFLNQVHSSNEAHKNYVAQRVAQLVSAGKGHIAVWGVTFKPNTDDMRDAASVPILTRLINEGLKVVVYDPQDSKARDVFGDKVVFSDDKFSAAAGASALLLMTEWREFDAPDFQRLNELMKGNLLCDLRNRWSPLAANRAGFDYYGIGRNYPLN